MILGVICTLLAVIVAILLLKIRSLHRAAEEITAQAKERMTGETNVGIDISISDRAMRRLAAILDRQLKIMREKQMRYTRGDRELKDAVANISHDLRTPLTAIRGYLDLLKEEEVSGEVREYLDIIEDRTERMRELTEEFFRYSVLRSVSLPKVQEKISLNRLLEEAAAAYYGAFTEAGIVPEIRMPDCQVVRTLNRQTVMRILENIISNGIKYSEGDFQMILREDGKLYFKNKTARLDKVQAGHLFERFYTVEDARKSTGLGLSIAKTLTEAVGGRIQAEYEAGVLSILVEFPAL
ncbi:MAG: sensor histidine kinase [Ruminococcus sp.]